MLVIRDGNFDSCFAAWKNNNFESFYLAKLSGKIEGLEALMTLKGKLIEDKSYYDDKLEERNTLLVAISLICKLSFSFWEMKALIEFVERNEEIKKYGLRIDEKSFPDFNLTSLGIYDEIIWKQIKEGILAGLMDNDIVKLKASIREDLKSIDLHCKRRMKKIEKERDEITSISSRFRDNLNIFGSEEETVENIRQSK